MLPPAVQQARNGREETQPGDLADRGEDRWNLAQLFLREVMGMDEERIATIRKLGDVLADEVVVSNDAQLAGRVLRADDYRNVRALLIRTSIRRVRSGNDPVTTLDEFLKVFEEGDEVRRSDWRLAWDLTCIRFIEILGKREWFARQTETAMGLEESDGDGQPT